MPGPGRLLPWIAIPLGMAGAVAWKGSHLLLLMRIAAGELDGQSLPVADFMPARARHDTVPLRLGALTFDAPPAIDLSESRYFEFEGLRGMIHAPCPIDRPFVKEVLPTEFSGDAVDLQAAVYRAGSGSLSLWMDAEDVHRLEELLKAKLILRPRADRVEVVRGQEVKGLLLIRQERHRTVLLFEYLSLDERMQGHALLWSESDCESAMNLARALIGSFRISLPPQTTSPP